MANVVYASDYEKNQAIDELQHEIDLQQMQVDRYDTIRDDAWEARKSARENLISAKEYLLSAIEFDDPAIVAEAKTAVQQAQQVADARQATYAAAREAAAANQDVLDHLREDLISSQEADIDPKRAADIRAEKEQTAESAETEDPFERARLDAEERYNAAGPTEQDVLAADNKTEPATKSVVGIVGPGSSEKYVPRINPLHQFATYTYSISLFILSKEDINTLTTNPASWVPGQNRVKTCLIASGGKNTGHYVRNSNFTDDFYFTDLKMTTVIGLNNRSKASNAIEISFGVIEPYGMSLLDRIMAAASDIQAPNFKAMPYLLEIDFYGSTDAGIATKLDSQRKRIPIQIIEMKIKAGTKGSEYQIKAVPWNHQALSQSAATVPINMEVKASTVGEFFYNNVTNAADQLAISKQDAEKMAASSAIQRKEQADKEAKKTDASGRLVNDPRRLDKVEPDASARVPTDEETIQNKGIVNRAFAVSSLCGGINGWYTDLLLKKLRGTKDQIIVNVHEDIAKTKIVVPATKDISRSAVRDDKPADAAKAASRDANRVFTDAAAFPISAGTSILQVIDMVMRNSAYITNQIKDPANMTPQDLAEREGKVLNWYKVIPTVEIGKYDYAMNKFSTVTTYHIMPYKVYDSKHPNGPSAAPKGSIKKYYYSYTGKNTDVIDFQMDFDTLYYTAVTAGAAKWQADLIQAAAQQQDDAAKVAANEAPAAAELINRQLKLVSAQPQSTGVGGTQNGTKPILVADIQKGLYSSSRGDMLNLKLKIVGDPELIKQDDIYTNPAQADYLDKIKTLEAMSDTGSIPMDTGEVMAQVEFRTIVDMNPLTGLPLEKPEYAKNSVFSGLYRMLTVDNVFANGKFEQTIDMVRVPDSINPDTKDAGVGKVAPRPANDKEDDGTANGTRAPESDAPESETFAGNDVDANKGDDTGTEPGDDAIEQPSDNETIDEADNVDSDEARLEQIEDNAEVVGIDDNAYTDDGLSPEQQDNLSAQAE